MRQRKVTRIVRGRNAVDGAGVRLRRILGDRTIQDFDPFLMLDGFDSTNPQDYIKGFPWHPHRGIETVTYLVSGTMAHEDSLGNKGVIRSMGCQWMTAGSGILHKEMPQPSERLLGCQLWVNLPATKKMVPPTYRDISLTDIPVVADKATVRILSGCYQGIRGALNGSHARVTYLDITLPAGILWSYEEAHNNETLFIYLLEGSLIPDPEQRSIEDKGCAILYSVSAPGERTHEPVVVKAGAEGARFLLLAARPLREPVASGGPRVMNTHEELRESFEELRNGTFIK